MYIYRLLKPFCKKMLKPLYGIRRCWRDSASRSLVLLALGSVIYKYNQIAQKSSLSVLQHNCCAVLLFFCSHMLTRPYRKCFSIAWLIVLLSCARRCGSWRVGGSRRTLRRAHTKKNWRPRRRRWRRLRAQYCGRTTCWRSSCSMKFLLIKCIILWRIHIHIGKNNNIIIMSLLF